MIGHPMSYALFHMVRIGSDGCSRQRQKLLEHTIYSLSGSLPDYLLLGQLAILVRTITPVYRY